MATNEEKYDQPLAMTTTNMFQANHEDAYDSDVDDGPNAAEMHQEEHLDSDAETEIDDNTIPYHQYLLDTEAQNVPTETGHARFTKKNALEVETLKNELSQCKQEIYRLDTQKVKLDLEHKVRLEQALGKEKSIAFLQSEKEKILSEKKDLADSYLDEIVVFKEDNQKKDICSIVLSSDIVVPPSLNCLCEDLRSACDREHTKVLELEAEILKQQQLVIESEKRFAFLEQNYVCLQLKFQNYKQCIDTSSASNAIFEINKLRDQLQGKDTTIRNLNAQFNIMKVLNVGSTAGSCDQQALETDRIQLKDTITSLRIQLDGLKVENSKTTSGTSKPLPKRALQNHSSLPAKSAMRGE
ncbi:hypothetical protein Tco_0968985 [Tanacetum coccineum]